jgi:hypothetical protein
MPTVEDNLATIREKLHDTTGLLWTDEELVKWFNDAYLRFLAQTRCVTELYQLDVPPRYAYAYSYEWEDAFTSNGPSRMMFIPALNAVYRCTGAWEVEFIEGFEPEADTDQGITQMWERYLTDSDRHYQVSLPQNHEIIQRVAWNNRVLYPTTVRELDELRSKWYKQGTQPHWWTNGTGRINTVEIYEIETEYHQAYAPLDYADHGFARTFSGDRTYAVHSSAANAYAFTTAGDGQALTLSPTALLTGLGWRFTRVASDSDSSACTHVWEEELLEGSSTFSSSTGYVCTYHWEAAFLNQTLPVFGVGTIRSITSPDRQYWAQNAATSAAFYGGIRQFQSSDEALEIWHTVLPREDLTLADTPDLLPTQAEKYLRYYVWARAFGRSGPAQNLELSAHYTQRFSMGVETWRKLTNVTQEDQVVVREQTDGEAPQRVPLVRLPSNFEAFR